MRNRWKEGGGGSGSSSSSVLLVASWYLSPFPSSLIFEKRKTVHAMTTSSRKSISLCYFPVITIITNSRRTNFSPIIITSHTREDEDWTKLYSLHQLNLYFSPHCVSHYFSADSKRNRLLRTECIMNILKARKPLCCPCCCSLSIVRQFFCILLY